MFSDNLRLNVSTIGIKATMWLLAQLIAPPLQPGPIRLPQEVPIERRSPLAPKGDQVPILQRQPSASEEPEVRREQPDTKPSSQPAGKLPSVSGSTPYSKTELTALLNSCVGQDPSWEDTLKRCAAVLTTRLVNDGYVNSRVYVIRQPAPGGLEVVEGRIAEVQLRSSDAGLERRLRKRLRGLQGSVLNLKRLEQTLVQLRSLPGVGQIKGSIGRLGADPSLAVVNLSVEAAAIPWQGDISLRNDGNAGTGEWRALGITLKNDLLTPGDTLLAVGELNADQQVELGATIASLSYTLPLTDQLKLTSSFGYSRRNLVEAPAPLYNVSLRQFQGYGQLEWVMHESPNQRWALFGGISGNRNDIFLDGRSIIAPQDGGWGQTGYARLGLSGGGFSGNLSWNGNVYGLQGMPSFSTASQLQTLGRAGIEPGTARALGGIVNVNWAITPQLIWSARGAFQVALDELTPDMGFSLGSDTGLKGLPGILVSGDNGYLWTTEMTWTFWSNQTQALQLVPFVGSGGINFWRNATYTSDTVGSAGAYVRWLIGHHWNLELGWVSPFDTEERLYWGNWTLSSGVYSKVQYRF